MVKRSLMPRMALALLLGLLLFTQGCTPGAQPGVSVFGRDQFPDRLSDWQLLLLSNGELVPNDRVIPYDIKSALFSDYAHKFRTVYVPEGAVSPAGESIQLPVGSILTKTFYYPKTGNLLDASATGGIGEQGLRISNVQLIETRLLVHLEEGWVGLPYVWNEAGTEAVLEITGAELDLTVKTSNGPQDFRYVVPDFNQCQGCHIENLTAGEMVPIGFKPRHLDKAYEHFHQADNQLDFLVAAGFLAERPTGDHHASVDWEDTTASIDDRARSYLDINCGHCHNPMGPADTSGMFLTRDTTEHIRLGYCKPPVAAGQGTGGRPVGIYPGAPERSILAFRMASDDLGAMMPELGRSLVHEEGVELVNVWISELSCEC